MSALYQEIQNRLKCGETAAIRTVLTGECGNIREQMRRSLETPEIQVDKKNRKCYQVQTIYEQGKESENAAITILEPITPKSRMLIFGGGHIALSLCEFAAKCGFAVMVADDRPEFANRERFPYAECVMADSYESSIKKLNITAYDYVVIVTRGHVHDADCLKLLLTGTEPAYMGLIGSKRRVQAQFDMLEQEGYSRERMNRICTPIGLNIGAATPAEIAVSILAEVIAHKRLTRTEEGRSTDNNQRICVNDSDLENEILDILADNNKPAALVTLIRSEGSSPRKAGAKMLVRLDGSISGTIGGGLVEGMAIQEAVRLIGTGQYKIMEYDLSGSVAEADGMVCGGRISILIEDFCS